MPDKLTNLQLLARDAVRRHYGSSRLGLAETRTEVLNAARKAAKGSACDMARDLISRLEIATAMPIATLAERVADWPTVGELRSESGHAMRTDPLVRT